MQFVKKSVIVVGGYGGIGMETCKILLNRGISNLGIFDLTENDEKLNSLQSDDGNAQIRFWKVDVTNKLECKTAFESAASEFGFIDFVVHSVGVVDELDPEKAIGVNLLGTINVNLAAIECMTKEKEKGRGGAILTISSVFGLEPCSSYPVYAAAKHGIIGFLRSLGTEDLYNRTGVKIIVVCPGFTKPSMPRSTPDAIFPYLPVGSPDDRFQPVADCAKRVVDAVEDNDTGTIWIIDNSELTQVAPIKYFFPPPPQ
ncbi:unnamed protein product [Hermetia illucens]|uniref:Alcohol dehydrogenase n=1 Tax=Hermetia illucens TaxID=343691 RepID=A0A7R8UAB1_HERIL|nr:alcohol dehydrogenase 2-like [Hermetia illucens]XP_037926316.1 alcohol dehydrogenase 2-like [Hermetia illucens]CAD7076846.1 unnamed protein product [Hermetia illucens]